MLCALILYVSDGIYSLKSISNHGFLRSFLWQFYLLSEFLPEICEEEVECQLISTTCEKSKFLSLRSYKDRETNKVIVYSGEEVPTNLIGH